MAAFNPIVGKLASFGGATQWKRGPTQYFRRKGCLEANISVAKLGPNRCQQQPGNSGQNTWISTEFKNLHSSPNVLLEDAMVWPRYYVLLSYNIRETIKGTHPSGSFCQPCARMVPDASSGRVPQLQREHKTEAAHDGVLMCFGYVSPGMAHIYISWYCGWDAWNCNEFYKTCFTPFVGNAEIDIYKERLPGCQSCWDAAQRTDSLSMNLKCLGFSVWGFCDLMMHRSERPVDTVQNISKWCLLLPKAVKNIKSVMKCLQTMCTAEQAHSDLCTQANNLCSTLGFQKHEISSADRDSIESSCRRRICCTKAWRRQRWLDWISFHAHGSGGWVAVLRVVYSFFLNSETVCSGTIHFDVWSI